MGNRASTRTRLLGLMLAFAAAFCIVGGGLTLTAFAQPQQADDQSMAAGSADMTAQDDAVSYINHTSSSDNFAVKLNSTCSEYTLVTTDTKEWAGPTGSGSSAGAWYVVSGNVTIEDRIVVTGRVRLILCDGATLTAKKGIQVTTATENLFIYGQSEGTGTLNAGSDANDEGAAGIGGSSSEGNRDAGQIAIHGGTVNAIGGNGAAGIGGGSNGQGSSVVVWDAIVNAIGGNGAAGIGGGSNGNGGAVNVYGSKVVAAGGTLAEGIGKGNGAEGSSNSLSLGARVTLEASSDGENWSEPTTSVEARTQYMKVTYTPPEPVSYWAWDETNKEVVSVDEACTDYKEVSSTSTSWGTSGKETWYVVKGDVAVDNRIEVYGTVNLILCDNATLTANKGVRVKDAGSTNYNNILNIYAQSDGDSTGKLIATGNNAGASQPSLNNAGIGGNSGEQCGEVTIHGGIVTATGGANAAGIGGGPLGGDGGTVTIHGGAVTATGGTEAAGIGGGSYQSSNYGDGGTVKINGGTVNATGTAGGAGIGGGFGGKGGPVTINGGIVAATAQTGGGVGIGYGANAGVAGTLDHPGITLQVSTDGTYWETYSSTRQKYMRTAPVFYDVTLSGGANATPDPGDSTTQKVAQKQSITTVTYTAKEKYFFEEFEPFKKSGVTVTWVSATEITVSGTPTATVEITVPNAKRNSAIPCEITLSGGANATPNPSESTTQSVTLGQSMDTVTYTVKSGYKFEEFSPIETNGIMVTRTSDTEVTVSGAPSDDVSIEVPNAVPDGPVSYYYYTPDPGEKTASLHRDGSCATYTNVKPTTTTWGTTDLSQETWYVVSSDVTIDERIDIKGRVRLILCDGATLTANQGIQLRADGGNTLDIYAQEEGTGALVATGHGLIEEWDATYSIPNFSTGIGGYGAPDVRGDNGTLTIHGGNVTATGGEYAAGIGGGMTGNGGSVTIYSGTVRATGGLGAAGIGGGVAGGGAGGQAANVKIFGGTVEAVGGANAEGALAPAEGIGRSYNCTSSYYGKIILGERVTLYGGIDGFTTELSAEAGEYQGTRYQYMSTTYTPPAPVSYMEWDGGSQKVVPAAEPCKEYTVVTASTTTFEDGKWYVVDGNVVLNNRVAVYGTANLILCDGARLFAPHGILVLKDRTLNIYAQSDGENMGRLVARGDSSTGIGGYSSMGSTNAGTVAIHGGKVTATGVYYNAGIGGATGGTVDAVNIYGGKVTAIGSDGAAGINGYGGSVSIYGGAVEGVGIGGAGIGGNKNVTDHGVLNLGNGVKLYGGDEGPTNLLATGSGGQYSGDRFKHMNTTGAVSYQAWNESSKAVADVDGGCSKYTLVTGGTTSYSDGKWYVVTDDVGMIDPIWVSGTAHLILCDGVTLNASRGINLGAGSTLNIYAQSDGANAGCLVATGEKRAGIGGNNQSGYGDAGTLIVHGGNVTANGATNAAGIGGGNEGAGGAVTIYGGNVIASGGEGAQGIGAGASNDNNGTITLADGVAMSISQNDMSWVAYDPATSVRARYMKTGESAPAIYTIALPATVDNATVSGETTQEVTSGTAMTDVTYTAAEGYVFPKTNSAYGTSNGVTVAVSTDMKTITVSGTPTDDVNITAIPAAGPAPVAVSGVSFDATSATLTVGEKTMLSVTIEPADATDKTVKWSVGGANASAVKLYSDEACTTEVGTEATDALTVYAKGESKGTATITATSNADPEKTATCTVAVNPVTYTVSLSDVAHAIVSGEPKQTVEAGAEMTVVTYTAESGYYFEEFSDKIENGVKAHWASDTNVTVSGTPTGNVNIEIPNAEVDDAVPYWYYTAITGGASLTQLNTDGRCRDYTIVTENTPVLGSGKWYVVDKNVTIDYRINVAGEAHLILCDGVTLTAEKGIKVQEGNRLHIYTQSLGDNRGKLVAGPADDNNAGIGGNNNEHGGTVVVHGGDVTATGGKNAAGIGGGSGGKGGILSVCSGTVTAIGGSSDDGTSSHAGAGIGGGDNGKGGEVNIYGGLVDATGGSVDVEGKIAGGAGIGGGNMGDGGPVHIYGGGVNAQGGKGAVAIGAGNKTTGQKENGTLAIASTVTVCGDDNPKPTTQVTPTGEGEITARMLYMTSTSPVDKTALEKGISDATTYHNDIATSHPDIAGELQNAIDQATGVKNKTDATQDDVNNEVDAINKALEKAIDDVKKAAKADAVKKQIEDLPKPENVTVNDKGDIEKAREAYDGLDDDQKTRVGEDALKKLEDDEKALENEQAADAVEKRIQALPDPKDVTKRDKDDIEKAREAYNGLDDDQKTRVDEELQKKLSLDEIALAKKLIEDLPDPTKVTTGDKDPIITARGILNTLTLDQQSEVGEELQKKLADDEVALAKKLIEVLPEPGDVTPADADDIADAHEAFEALDDEQKGQIPSDLQKKLADDEKALEGAEVEAVKKLIEDLPNPNDVTPGDADDIADAREAFDNLTTDQKGEIPSDLQTKLSDDEVALAKKLIEDLPEPGKVTPDNADDIIRAKEAFDNLTLEQQGEISSDLQKKLNDDAVNLAKKFIEDLPDPDKVTKDHINPILNARGVLETLTTDQQKEVGEELQNKLNEDEVALAKKLIEDLPAPENVTKDHIDPILVASGFLETLEPEQQEQIGADEKQKLSDDEVALAKKLIEDLPAPENVTKDDREPIIVARGVLDTLTPEQQDQISPDLKKKLRDDENALADAEDGEIAAVKKQIEDLPDPDKVVPGDKDAINKAREAYDGLTPDQQSQVGKELRKKLEADEKALAEAADKAAVKAAADKINALPPADKVTTADKAAIEDARAAYDALTMEQKALLDEDPSILAYLLAAEEALKAAESAAPIDKAVISKIDDQLYTAAPIEPAFEVTLDGKKLAAGTDYDAKFDNNVEVSTATGAATVTVTGKGAYKGTVTATFKITSLAKKEAATRMADLDAMAWYMGGDGTRGGFFGPESDTLYMDYTLAKGLISGYKDEAGNVTGFRPDTDLTRAQAAVIVYRMANPGSTDTYSDTAAAGIANANKSTLPDVEDGRYYTAAVNWCVANGVVTGYTRDDGTPYAFGPEDGVTREQLATIIGRYMDPKAAAGKDVSGFEDSAKMSDYAKAGIAYCNANGIMTGIGGTRAFDPQGNASRCQMAKVIAVTDRLRTAK